MVYPSNKGFYYRYEESNKPQMKFYDYLEGIQQLRPEFNVFCEQYCEQITTIVGNVTLLNKKRNSADILKLNVSTSK